jgi:long-chain fatty acid transport protein
MKKLSFFVISFLTPIALMAGGIVTNTNQSAMFTRMQARDATLGIDAVYYNPAGLTLLPNDGFFISLNNQTVGQTRTVESDYQYLNQSKYTGKIFAPFFPGIYAAYKKGNLALSLGFNPIGGGAGGTYDDGLPSFEYNISDLVPGLVSKGQDIRAYSMDAYFEGSTAYFGYQFNVSYKINDMISVALGARYVMANEAYNGYLHDIRVDSAGTRTTATSVFTSLAAGAHAALSAPASLQQMIDGGAGSLTLAQAEALSIINAQQRAGLESGLRSMAIDPSAVTISQAKDAFVAGAPSFQLAEATATAKASLLRNQEADMEKKATGFTPIISVNIHPSDNLNIALKYEGLTKLEFENNTTKDFTVGYTPAGVPITQFPDGKKSRYDIPAQLVAGVTYRPIEKLFVSAGFHYYFDKQADWEGRDTLLKGNLTEYALGLEYTLSKKLLVSAGWLTTQTGAEGAYQTDLSFSMNSNTIGGGFAYQILPYLELNLAGAYTMYAKDHKTFNRNGYDSEGLPGSVAVTETYDKNVWIVALGLNFNLGAMKK